MTQFAMMAALMIGAAMLFVLPPLLKGRPASDAEPAQSSLAVYRQQLAELEADVRQGILSATLLEESRRDLQCRLLEDVAEPNPVASGVPRRAWQAAVAVGLSVPLLAVLLYVQLGAPQAIGVDVDSLANPHASSRAVTVDPLEIATQRLASRLESAPDDTEGWALLGRSYMVLGKHLDAVPAFRRALTLMPDDADVLADFADALAMTQGGRLQGEPLRAVRRALKVDPGNVKALALAGTEAFDRGDRAAAVRYWTRAVALAPPDSEFAASLRASLAEAQAPSGRLLPAATAASVSGQVTLAPKLLSSVSPEDTVLVFARAAGGMRMPLALVKARVKDLPLRFTLDDTSSMVPGMALSSFDRVVLVARVSRTGMAQAQPGDLEGEVGPVTTGARDILVRIDRRLE